jgi:phospholipase A1
MENKYILNKLLLIFGLSLSLSLSGVASAGVEDFALCAKNYAGDDAARLKCFDRVQAAVERPQAKPDDAPTAMVAQVISGTRAPKTEEQPADERSYLTRVWDLDNESGRDRNALDRLRPHKQNYLIIRKSNNVDMQPVSPAPAHAVLAPYDFAALEAKYQLSFKTDIATLENLNLWGLKTLRVWGAYSQQSHWQVFNTRNSSPFRETNYEPELIAAFGTGNESGWKLLNLGLLHQSNGKPNPESRSWNRLYAQGGWEWGSLSLMGRGWWRIPESAVNDDNPDITHYLGHGDLVLRWEPDSKKQALAFMLRNNLSLNGNMGFMQLDWSMPVELGRAARLHAQITNGYGESLIDYNHRQTTIGIGVSFREW